MKLVQNIFFDIQILTYEFNRSIVLKNTCDKMCFFYENKCTKSLLKNVGKKYI